MISKKEFINLFNKSDYNGSLNFYFTDIKNSENFTFTLANKKGLYFFSAYKNCITINAVIDCFIRLKGTFDGVQGEPEFLISFVYESKKDFIDDIENLIAEYS